MEAEHGSSPRRSAETTRAWEGRRPRAICAGWRTAPERAQRWIHSVTVTPGVTRNCLRLQRTLRWLDIRFWCLRQGRWALLAKHRPGRADTLLLPRGS